MRRVKRRVVGTLLFAVVLSGCANAPYQQFGIDSTSSFRNPGPDKAGIYVYRWKTGIYLSATNINFEIKGQRKIALNTGEYGYIEVPPGTYEYKILGGFAPIFVPIKLEAGQNYFFLGSVRNFTDHIGVVQEQSEIDEAKKNIMSGRYKLREAN